jgi:ParB family chromosome partitioning protein
MATIAGAESRGDLHRFDPNRLVIVTDPGNVLCQEVRNRTPTPEWLVLSIMALGVTTPIQVRRGPKVDGEFTYEVVVGRQRVKAAREANKRLIKARQPPVLIKVEVVQGTDEDMLALMRSENVRVDMTPLERAETAKISISKGVSELKVINDSFRGSKAEYERHMALLACHPGVVAAIEDGRLSIKAVDTFTELTRDDQGALLERMVAEGKTGPREARTIAATAEETLEHNGTGRPGDEPKTRTKSTGPKTRRAQEIADRLAALEAVSPDEESDEGFAWHIRETRIQELKWALGDDDSLATASDDDLGGWVSSVQAKAAKADEMEAKKLAAKQDKASARAAAKAKAKADKAALRETERQAARDKIAADNAKKADKKARAAAKRSTKEQLDLEASLPKVPNRSGKGRSKK